MDLKIVSGVLITKEHREGRAVIDFGSNNLVDGDLEADDLQKRVRIAPREPEDMINSYFDQKPAHNVALRQIKQVGTLQDNTRGPSRLVLIDDMYQINTTVSKQRLTVHWKTNGFARIEEITYLAIGPVSPPPPGPY